jgi:hypothetical protein
MSMLELDKYLANKFEKSFGKRSGVWCWCG